LKTTRSHKHSKDKGVLIDMAESVGSTLGSIVARADAAQKALTGSKLTTKVERESKRLVRKRKKIAGNLRKTKLPRAARRVATKLGDSRRRSRVKK
jgi:hypothetical protein